jgi:hypothetical protein
MTIVGLVVLVVMGAILACVSGNKICPLNREEE